MSRPLRVRLAKVLPRALAWRSRISGSPPEYNRPGFDLFTADVYALCGDGCMMEGISNEAASLAGHLQLDNLCWIYDNNHVTIEGHTNITFRDDVASRFLSYGWNVQRVGDANDLDMLERAFSTFKKTSGRPSAHYR